MLSVRSVALQKVTHYTVAAEWFVGLFIDRLW